MLSIVQTSFLEGRESKTLLLFPNCITVSLLVSAVCAHAAKGTHVPSTCSAVPPGGHEDCSSVPSSLSPSRTILSTHFILSSYLRIM